jgi:hypothetical protein
MRFATAPLRPAADFFARVAGRPLTFVRADDDFAAVFERDAFAPLFPPAPPRALAGMRDAAPFAPVLPVAGFFFAGFFPAETVDRFFALADFFAIRLPP